MIPRHLPWLGVALVVGVTLALMWGPMREDTATGDETVFLGAGHSYWLGYRYYLNVEHPPLMQLWSALPLQFLDVKLPDNAGAYFDETYPSSTVESWDHYWRKSQEPIPLAKRFYHVPAIEALLFGHNLVYGGQNDADKLLFWGRFMQALVMLATGLLVFLWARSLSNPTGGLLALAAWTFNPIALAYGHLIITDPGIALMLTLAVWMFSRFLESPRPRTASIAAVAFAGALLSKYTAIILVPIFGLLAVVAWWQQEHTTRGEWVRNAFGNLWLFVAVTWGTVLLFYIPHWSPAPSLPVEYAHRVRAPEWFIRLRWFLIPRDFFKGFAIMLLHAANGHRAYLLSQWSDQGWWYYFPLAILIKTPVALLLLLASGFLMALQRMRRSSFAETAPLIAAVVYLGCAIPSKVNIGIRHVLPIYPLLAVVVGIQYGRAGLRDQVVGWLLAAWLVVTAFVAHSDYIAYFNELVGGPAHGCEYLIDSNYDWGQSGKRLKKWMQTNHIASVYIDYFGTDMTLEYLRIPYQAITPDRVPGLSDGYLVISASQLMSHDYDWLRKTNAPVARISNTLFVYSLPVLSGELQRSSAPPPP